MRLIIGMFLLALTANVHAAQVGDYVKYSILEHYWGTLSYHAIEIISFDAKSEKFKIKRTEFDELDKEVKVSYKKVKKSKFEAAEAHAAHTYENCDTLGTMETVRVGNTQVNACKISVGSRTEQWISPEIPSIMTSVLTLYYSYSYSAATRGLVSSFHVLEFRKGQ